ncbi:hypothetical protein JHK84_045388 [Glycine max]|nr:hypothetical protein JHK86_045333 [Glycine max]KAG4952052.1 hypothetical protein JHK85_045919 [Glycine max]KAG5108481.1 hypothetical protein JHK84_045388 [Glycine max]
MKAYGENMTNEMILDKILCKMIPRFDHIVVAIKESKNVESMKIEELHGSLEAHEMRLEERSSEKSVDQSL